MTSRTHHYRDVDIPEYALLLFFLWCSKIGIVKLSQLISNLWQSKTTRDGIKWVKSCLRTLWQTVVAIFGFCMPSFSVLTVAVILYLLYYGGQSKDARISPEVPVASQAPPSVEVPVYLAPSSAIKPNDEDKNEFFGNTPALSPSHTDSESSQRTGNDDVQPKPEVSPPGGEVPNRPEKPDVSQEKTVKTTPDVGGEKDLRQVQTPQDVDLAVDLQGQGQGQAAGDIAKSGEKSDNTEVKDSPKSTDPAKESEVIQENGGEQVGTEDGKSLPLAGTVDTTEAADLTEKSSDDKEGQGHNEDPIVTEQHEDIPSFDE